MRALLRLRQSLSKTEFISQWKSQIWPFLEYPSGVLGLACDSQLSRLDSFQRGFLNELEITEEEAFLEHNFLPPTLRRRIALLGFCHKVALGPNFCHPTLVAALPCTEDDQGAKVFRCNPVLCTEFRERLFSRILYGALIYYNSICSASRRTPSVETFQSGLTS